MKKCVKYEIPIWYYSMKMMYEWLCEEEGERNEEKNEGKYYIKYDG